MTEFETQLLAGQAILIKQIGQIAGDLRWLKQREIEREKGAPDLARQIAEGGGLEVLAQAVSERKT